MELKLETNEVQALLNALATRPYLEVAQLINKIADQVKEQQKTDKE